MKHASWVAVLAVLALSCAKVADRPEPDSRHSGAFYPSSTSGQARVAAPARAPAASAASIESSTGAPAPEPGTADLDASNDDVVAPPEAIADCEARLTALGVSFARAELKLHTSGRVACGAPQAVLYKGRAGGPRWSSPQEGKFLRALARKAYDDGVFSVVLTEFFDTLHRDHFHVDMARYRVDGTR